MTSEATCGTSPTGASVGALLLGSAATVAPGRTSDEAARAEELLWTTLASRSVLAWSLQVLLQVPQVEELVLLVEPGREGAAAEVVREFAGDGRRITVTSSADPAEVVLLGLESLSDRCRLALIHQASRPLVRAESLLRGLGIATAHAGSGAVAYLPVRETIKRTSGDVVVSTLPREELALLRTPQVFPVAALRAAYQVYRRSHATLPADPALVAFSAGLSLLPFPADADDILIAVRQDLEVAESQLRGRMA